MSKKKTSFELPGSIWKKFELKTQELGKKLGFKVSKAAALQMMIEQFKV